MIDVTFHSTALNRDMPYRVVLPADVSSNKKFAVVYLLHGGGGSLRDWSNYSDVARFAERGLIPHHAGGLLVVLHECFRAATGPV
jgi:poly(3-hydroxybutyrate) depolymerase